MTTAVDIWVMDNLVQGDLIREEGHDEGPTGYLAGYAVFDNKMYLQIHYTENFNDMVYVDFRSIDCVYTDVDCVKIYRLKR